MAAIEKGLFWVEYYHRKTKKPRVEKVVHSSRYLVQVAAILGTGDREKHRVFGVRQGVVYELIKKPDLWARVPTWEQLERLQTIQWLCELTGKNAALIGVL